MALNSSETKEERDMRIARLASKLLNERMAFESRAGGLTPEKLQELTGRLAEESNPGWSVVSLPDMLHRMAAEYPEVEAGTHELDPREWGANLMLMLMYHAYMNAYDLYQATYDYFNLVLQGGANLANGEA